MRSGKLDRVITIREVTYVSNGMGGQTSSWSDVADLRAQLIQQSTEEFIANHREDSDDIRIFRTRFMEGLKTSNSVRFEDREFNIREIKVMGRNRYMELRCVADKSTS